MGGFAEFGGYDFGNVASSLRADLPETPWVMPAPPAYSLDIPRVSAETPGLGGCRGGSTHAIRVGCARQSATGRNSGSHASPDRSVEAGGQGPDAPVPGVDWARRLTNARPNGRGDRQAGRGHGCPDAAAGSLSG